jgi:hypothetical protein
MDRRLRIRISACTGSPRFRPMVEGSPIRQTATQSKAKLGSNVTPSPIVRTRLPFDYAGGNGR